jgi:RHS repeat-associated protein
MHTHLIRPAWLLPTRLGAIAVVAAAVLPHSGSRRLDTPPVVTITPGTGSVSTSTASLAMTIGWCDDGKLMSRSRQVKVNGVIISSTYTQVGGHGCADYGTSNVTANLIYGNNVIEASIPDDAGQVGSSSVTITRPLPSWNVVATPDNQGVSVARKTRPTQRFGVKSTGNRSARYNLTSNCTGSINQCAISISGAPASYVDLNPSDSVAVDVAYYAGSTGSASGRIQLFASYTDSISRVWADSGWANVTITPTIAVSPDNQTVTPAANAPGRSQIFNLDNSGAAATFNLQVTCSGSASGCSAPSSVSVGAGQRVPVTVNYTSGGAGISGRIVLQAVENIDAGNLDSGYVSVMPVFVATPVINVDSANSGSTVARDLCLSIANSGGGYECGDLRLVHALPTTRTLNVARTPKLVYLSDHATPHMIVRVDVTQPSGSGSPDSITAILRDTTGAALTSQARWDGAAWVAGATNRIALDFATEAKPTGVYKLQVEVTGWYPVGPVTASIPTREYVVVNRQNSPFGAGWWLAGLERLYKLSNGFLWVGGDGSTRVYAQDVNHPNVYRAPNVNRPDSLVRAINGSDTTYTRYLRHKATVSFDRLLRHVATSDWLQRQTQFVYTDLTDTVRKIVLPANGLTREYTFTYSSAQLTISAPPVGAQSRQTIVSFDPTYHRLTSIRDPDNTVVSFGYPSSGNVRTVTQRTNRRGHTTIYRYDVTDKLAGDSADATSVARTFRPAESVGIVAIGGTSAKSRDSAVTIFDGPRRDVADRTEILIDQFGAPARVRDAMGAVTSITRDAAWPSLVRLIQSPNGRKVSATYDAQGLMSATTDSSTYQDSTSLRKYATTSYTWAPGWEFVTRIVPPQDSSTSMAYDPQTGQRLWQQTAGDTTRFTYDASTKLLKIVQSSNGGRDSLGYDAAGNLAIDRTPLGFAAYHFNDAVGRDTLVVSPVDASDTTALRTSGGTDQSVGLRTLSRLDLADQDTLTLTYGGGDTVFVRKHFDAEGNADSVSQRGGPDINGIGWIRRGFVFDRLGRQTSEVLNGASYINYTYDDGANLVSGGRVLAGGVTSTYDALNRVVTRNGDAMNTFTYDVSGNVLTADNLFAHVRRTYNPNGTIATDTLRIATTDSTRNDFSQHVYGIAYNYDRSGRRLSMALPGELGGGTVAYAYDGKRGQLESIVDADGTRYALRYDQMGRLSSLVRRAGLTDSILETRTYDLDSRQITRVQQAAGTTLHSDVLTYDARGKVLHQVGPGGNDDLSYDRLGQLVSSLITRQETFEMDPIGNRKSRTTFGNAPSSEAATYDAATGRLNRTVISAGGEFPDTTTYYYDALGNTGESHVLNAQTVTINCNIVCQTATQYVHRHTFNNYGNESRLIASRFQQDTTIDDPNDQSPTSWIYRAREAYRYDALGRRIWVRSVKDAKNNSGTLLCEYAQRSSGCHSAITRTVWDGNAPLYEIRTEGSDTANVAMYEYDDPNLGTSYGRVRYLNGPTLDEPLGVVKGSGTIHPFTDWRGSYDIATCPVTVCSPSTIWLPGTSAGAYGDGTPPIAGPPSWYGTLLEHGTDASGYQYRRNRYYDPSTGRFTQEDPIGLAGGMNLYGFAGGDPVNYSDPFGLCPPYNKNTADCSPEVQRLLAVDRPIQSQMTNKGIIKTSAVIASVVASGSVLTRLVSRAIGSLLGDEVSTNFSDKISRQMSKRGWTASDIDETIESPYTTRSATNKSNNNPATAYFNKDGSYVVRDNESGDVIQISNRNDPNWVPDQTIKNPYRPQ